MLQFAIHESNLDRLQKKVNRIRNKCVKYGCDFHYAEVGEEFRTWKDEYGLEHTERFVLVEAEGTAKVNGWRFIATVDHTEAGNIIRKMTDDVEVPEKYYTADPECEHCHSHRHRKDTYIVYNEETNEFKQVGSSCLCDFTGGLSAEAAASYISLFDSLMEFEAPGTGYTAKVWYEVRDVLRYAVDFVNHIGYASTQDSYGDYNPDSTKNKVIAALDYERGRATKIEREMIDDYRFKFGNHSEDPEVLETVETIINYFKENDEAGDYMHNLRVIANSDYIEGKSIGYTVSMVATYNRHIQKVVERERRKSAHAAEVEASDYIGEVGERIEVVSPAKVETVTYWENQFGTTIRYKIVDADGNVLMWDSSTYIDQDREVKSIKGTVKKLDTFNNVKQTWLTRCRVAYAQ
jgi:hypothetical protein